MQQEFLTIASKHAQERLQSAQSGKGPDVNCLVDAAREAMDNFVRAQKKFLDVLAENGVKSRKHEETSKKKTEISKLAREAAGSFIDAQKKLLDLAGQQVNVNLQAATRAVEVVNALRPRPLPTLTGEGVKNFVEAEKAVIESFMKPTEVKPVRSGKRPRHRSAATPHAAEATA